MRVHIRETTELTGKDNEMEQDIKQNSGGKPDQNVSAK